MGMYNEVYKNCPECERRCEIQIGQIVLGFGCFDLDNPRDLASRLDAEQLVDLKEMVASKTFYCSSDDGGCGNSFTSGGQVDLSTFARDLFKNGKDCPCCGYPRCGHDHDDDL